jgi:histidinol-phosphatase
MSSKHLEVALDAVQAAEKIIRHYAGRELDPMVKTDQSPVTVADQEAEQAIRQVIGKAFPDHTFYGEEGGQADLTDHRGYTWIIDPIDGTKNFIRHIPTFGTILGLMHDGEFVLGVTNVPMLGELMYAEKGGGAFLNGERVRVKPTAELRDAYVSFGGIDRFTENNQSQELLRLAGEVHWTRGFGDIYGYHLLAQGKIDVMLESTIKLWDIAAQKVIVEEAGGRFTQLDGGEVTAATTSALATNGVLHDKVLSYF